MTDEVGANVGAFAASGERQKPEHLSDLLVRLSRRSDDSITIRDVAIALQDRSFGAFLLVFSVPNLVPMPPGATILLGLPLIFVAWQMFASPQGRIYLPRRIGDYGVTTATFQNVVNRILPWLRRAETWVKPRFWFLETRFSERLLGIFALVLAITVFLPIPFGNWLPALALAIIGFAHSECDGIGVLVGSFVGVLSIVVAAFVIYTAGAVLLMVF